MPDAGRERGAHGLPVEGARTLERRDIVGECILRVAAFDEGCGEVFHDVTISVVPNDASIPTLTGTRTFVPTGSATPPASACVGDCDRDTRVTVSELVTGINIALDSMTLDRCPVAACAQGSAGGRRLPSCELLMRHWQGARTDIASEPARFLQPRRDRLRSLALRVLR